MKHNSTRVFVSFAITYIIYIAGRRLDMSLVDGKSEIPVGLGMRLSLDMKAMTNFSNLSEARKRELISYIEGSTTGEDAKNRVTEVVNSLHNGDSFS